MNLGDVWDARRMCKEQEEPLLRAQEISGERGWGPWAQRWELRPEEETESPRKG